MFPIDPEADLAGLPPRDAALRIGRLNEEMIRSCSAIVANITPFRGPSADVGTAYEMGFGRAIGLVVSAYSNVTEPFTSRTLRFLGMECARNGRRSMDRNGMSIEEWGLTDNLMLESCIAASGGSLILQDVPASQRYTDLEAFERCLAILATAQRFQQATR